MSVVTHTMSVSAEGKTGVGGSEGRRKTEDCLDLRVPSEARVRTLRPGFDQNNWE